MGIRKRLADSLGTVVLLVVMVGCQTATPTQPAQPSGSGGGSAQPSGQPSSQPSGQATPAPAGKPSSQSLIAADLASGAIDLATSLELRAWTLFSDPRLPERYDGAGSLGEDNALFADIASNLATFSADKQTELGAYLLRPTDPASPFSTPPASARSSGQFQLAQAEVTPAPQQCTAPRQWFDEPWSPDGNVDHGLKAWACGPSRATVQADLDKVIAIGSALWPKMTAAEPNGMGPPVPDTGATYDDGSGKIDVYLVEPLAECRMRGGTCQTIPADEEGEQAAAAAPKDYPEHCAVNGFAARACSGYMLLRRDRLDDAAFPADFAHEFFHLLQYAHNGKVDITWYHEASAVWAEWYYENAAAKEDADGHFQSYQADDRSLLWYDYDQNYQYQAWGWPLFQFTEKGASNVFQTWPAIENLDTRSEVDQAVDSQLAFEGTFRDFAVRNAQPNDYIEGASTGLDDYRWQTRQTQPTLEDFPTDQHLLSLHGTEISMGKNSHPADVQPLAAQYDLYKVTDNNIAQIEIDITGLAHADQADLDVVAQVTTPDNWHRFKASGGKLKLCREKADQNVVDSVEVVISNHAVARDGNGPDVEQSVKGDYTIEAKDNCDEQPVFLHGTFTGHKDGDLDTTNATFDLTVKWNRPNDFNDPLNFQFVEGSFTFDTTVVGVCAGSLSEGGKLDLAGTDTQGLTYGDGEDSARYVHAGLRDDRADGEARLAFFLVAHFETPPVGDPACQPPFQPYGDVAGCPVLFNFLTADTLATDASCENDEGSWTGHLVEQGNP